METPTILKKRVVRVSLEDRVLAFEKRLDELEKIEKRLTELEIYCYETIEVGSIPCWDPSQGSPRETQIQREVKIWRIMNPLRKTTSGTREDPIVISD